jgi:spermidine synthase
VGRCIAVLCLILSGAAGLVHEVAWIRRATLVFGSTTWALSTVLAVFFLGLAAGSAFFARIADRTRRPLLWFGALELGVALLALASPYLFDGIDALYGHVYRVAGGAELLHGVSRVVLVAAVLLPPTLLMGGAFPLCVRSILAADASVGLQAGSLYAANTLGAVGGCLLAGFVGIPRFGISSTIAAGAVLNLIAGAAAASIRGRAAPRIGRAAPALPDSALGASWVTLVFFGCGFVALGLEVLWTRQLSLIVRSSVHTYTLMLAVVLVGIALGSALAAQLADRLRSREIAFGLCPIGIALCVTASTALPPRFWQEMGSPLAASCLLILPAAVFSGASLPLALRLRTAEASLAAGAVGRLIAVNTLGGIAGSLGVAFFVLPALGLAAGLRVVTGAALALGALAWTRSEVPATLRWGGVAVALVAWLTLPLASGVRVPEDFLAGGRELVGFWEGRTGHVAVVREAGALQLEIDRWWQGSEQRNHQTVAAHVPLLLHPAPRRVLLVGVGAGQTPARMLLHDVELLDCVDLEPAIFAAIRRHFDATWLEDPRVRTLVADGRTHILHGAERYDVISLEPGQVFRPGVAFFYSEDFYRRARARLRAGGIVAQFVPLPFLTTDEFRAVVRSFRDVFPASVLWYNTAELLLLGFESDRVRVDPARLERLASDAALRADLDYRHWGGANLALHDRELFLAGLLVGPAGLAEIGRGAESLRDDRVVLDHATSGIRESETRELPTVALLRERLEPAASALGMELEAGAGARIAQLQRRNLDAIEADALTRSVAFLPDPTSAEVALRLERALALNPDGVRTQRMLGDLANLRGDPRAAEAHYRTALALGGEELGAHRGLAVALLALRRAREAAAHLRLAAALDPADPGVHNDLGVALAQQDLEVPAQRAFEQALRLDPEHEDARANLRRLEQQRRARP